MTNQKNDIKAKLGDEIYERAYSFLSECRVGGDLPEIKIRTGLEMIVADHPQKRMAKNYAMQLDMIVFQELMKEGKI